jgi:hypothetical protein
MIKSKQRAIYTHATAMQEIFGPLSPTDPKKFPGSAGG